MLTAAPEQRKSWFAVIGRSEIQGGILRFRGGNGCPLLRFLPFRRTLDGREKVAGDGSFGNREDDVRNDGPATASKLIVPLGLAVSCIAHLAFLTPAIILGGANPFPAAPADAIMVDIVSSVDVDQPAGKPAPAEAAKETAAKETPSAAPEPPSAPAPQTTTSAPAPPPPVSSPVEMPERQAAAAPPVLLPSIMPPLPFAQQPDLPQPAEPDDSNAPFGMPMTMPDGTVGGRTFDQAEEKADVTKGVVAAFRSHLKTCAKRPAEVAPGARVVVRLYLNPDGSLVRDLPENPKTLKVSMGGGELFVNARAALIECQPYTMLPPDRYPEWKMLDLTFTPENFP
jgi:hypothetical protein